MYFCISFLKKICRPVIHLICPKHLKKTRTISVEAVLALFRPLKKFPFFLSIYIFSSHSSLLVVFLPSLSTLISALLEHEFLSTLLRPTHFKSEKKRFLFKSFFKAKILANIITFLEYDS